MLSFFPRGVSDEILNSIESVSVGFSYLLSTSDTSVLQNFVHHTNSLVSQISKIRNLWIFGGKINMTRQSLKAMNARHYAAVAFTMDLQCRNANLSKILSYYLKLCEFISKSVYKQRHNQNQ